MPQLIKDIDQIAREKQRDVLFLEFERFLDNNDDDDRIYNYEWEADTVRKKILEDLTEMGITWIPCGDVANEKFFDMGYCGAVYIDVPFDKELPLYQKLEAYLEYPDGTIRFENINFYILELSTAMKNAHHDEPGFWEKWAEEF